MSSSKRLQETNMEEIKRKNHEIENQRYAATGNHYVPEMYTLICAWLWSIKSCSKYDITDHCKVMDMVQSLRNAEWWVKWDLWNTINSKIDI